MSDATPAPAAAAKPQGSTAAMTLGIIGGVLGILAGILAMMIGGAGAAFEAEGSGTVAGLGFAGFFLGVLGIVGGALSKSKPKPAAIMQGLSGVLGFIAVSAFWLLAGPLLLIGAFLAYRGSKV